MKGLALIFQAIIVGFFVIAIFLILLGVVAGNILDIRDALEENEQITRTINLAQVVLSSNELCYSDGDHVYRGIFDRDKLEAVESNPNILFSRIRYPSDSDIDNYFIKIEDKENSESWEFKSETSIITTFSVSRKFPVAIRYSEDVVHVGVMEVKISGEKIALKLW